MKSFKNKNVEYEGVYRLASKSFGFVKIFNDNENEEEIYIAAKDSLSALNDDRVLVQIKPNKVIENKKREGVIVKILERNDEVVVGIFEPNKGYGFVTPINSKIPFDIHIEKKYFNQAVKGSIVEVRLFPKKNNKDNPEGVIIKVLGHKDDPNDEITAIVHDFKIRDEFSKEQLDEANSIAIPISDDDFKDRKDLRDKCFVTIDGEDTKDIDDAVYLEKIENGFLKLYVSIADVSHYIKEGSKLDVEALKRGNSVYLLDRVIPMIPHVLSNGMCSLNEGEDRLTLTCEMEFDEKGNIVNYDIYRSIINSHKRMTYTLVQSIIDDDTNNQCDLNYEINKMLKDMIELSRKIRDLREKRGAINFNFKETEIVVDENLKPIDIKEKDRIEAYKLIEDFMVSANETVAQDFYFRDVPFIYRSHEANDEEKIENLNNTLNALGISFHYKNTLYPMDIQKLLKSVEGKSYQNIVEMLVLRSMSQARYTKKLIGHFALASKYYTHFTSPIRRYSDLQIHRIINEALDNQLTAKRIKHYDKILDSVALNISKTERVAIDCERDIDQLKKCEYMLPYLGERFEGVVSGLTNFGIFVELPNTVEGMVALRDIKDDHYVFDETKYQIIGANTKRIFRFGQKVKVILAKCTPETRNIDFILDE